MRRVPALLMLVFTYVTAGHTFVGAKQSTMDLTGFRGQQECVQWGTRVRLKGTVEVARIFGPPNFGETPNRDQEFLIHRLYAVDTNFCFTVGSSGEPEWAEFPKVDTIQLRYLSVSGRKINAGVESGLCYIVEGKIFPSLGEPMHREPTTLDVESAETC